MASLIAVILLCVAIPFATIAMLVPSLRKFAPMQENYHGAMVLSGLGIVWFVWLAGIWIGEVAFEKLGLGEPAWMSLVMSAFPLLAGTCAFGLFDDWVGDNHSKGFKGHFRALRHGELTTGMLKMVGIGMLALFTAIQVCPVDEPLPVLRVLCAGFTIALFANLMNLFDLRPLRASKIYIISIAICIVVLVFTHRLQLDWLDITCTIVACLGPVVATWKWDNWEMAMLGDAGANTMGALVGYILAVTLPTWLLLAFTIFLFAVNLLSEKCSFSHIIERIPVLRNADKLFRPTTLIDEPSRPNSKSGKAHSSRNRH